MRTKTLIGLVGGAMLYGVLGFAPQLSAQEAKTLEQVEQKQENSVAQEIGECVGAIKDYWVSFQEQEATQCLVNYTNPDTWNPIGAKAQAVECGVRALVDHARHITPSESQRQALENLTAVYDGFQTVRRAIEHPDPNAELMYKAIDDHIAEMDRRSQSLAKVGDKECGEMWGSIYNAGKSVFDSATSDPDMAGKEELVIIIFSERLGEYVRTTPVHAQNGHAAAAIMDAVKKELKNKAQNTGNIESILPEPSINVREVFRKPSVHEGVTSDQYVRTNDLYNKSRVERGLNPVENLSPRDVDEVRIYNEILRHLKESDGSQTQNGEASQRPYEPPRPNPELISEPIREPSAPTHDPGVDGAGRTSKENTDIDKGFRDKHPELGGRRLDPKDPKDKELIREWVKDAKEHDKTKSKK